MCPHGVLRFDSGGGQCGEGEDRDEDPMMCELPALYRDGMYKARKDHVCCECQRTINKGDMYQRAEGCWDGHFETFKTCKRCARLRDKLARKVRHWDDGPNFTGLRDYLWECSTLYQRLRAEAKRSYPSRLLLELERHQNRIGRFRLEVAELIRNGSEADK